MEVMNLKRNLEVKLDENSDSNLLQFSLASETPYLRTEDRLVLL
jgi:hypothetical protein